MVKELMHSFEKKKMLPYALELFVWHTVVIEATLWKH